MMMFSRMGMCGIIRVGVGGVGVVSGVRAGVGVGVGVGSRAEFSSGTNMAGLVVNGTLFLKNGEEQHDDEIQTPDQLLSRYQGAFSSCRTIGGGNQVVMWEKHVQRTLSSMTFTPSPSDQERIISHTEETIRNGLVTFRNTHNPQGDLRFTLLLAEHSEKEEGGKGVWCEGQGEKEGKRVDVWLGVSQLPKMPERVIVEVREGMRENPEAKTTDWVKERKKEQFRISPPVHEVVLVDSEGRLYEGGSSNVIVHELPNQHHQNPQDSLLRPPKGTVLEGTTLALLEKVCSSPSSPVPFLFSFASLSDFRGWGGVGITSTSRGLLRVHELRLKKDLVEKYGLGGVVKGEVEGEEGKVWLELAESELLGRLGRKLEEALSDSSCVPGEQRK